MILLIFLRLIKAVEILDSVSSFELFEISCFRVYTPPYNFLVVIYHCKSANPLFYEFSIKVSRNWYSDVIKFCDSHKALNYGLSRYSYKLSIERVILHCNIQKMKFYIYWRNL